jgi:GWxTD domain-containing protein
MKYQARLDYVIKNYWKENSQQPWNTDRSRVYLLNGSPASIDYDQNVDFASALPGQMAQATSRSNEDVAANRGEIWTYPSGPNFIRYIFIFVQPNQWKMTATGTRYLGELEDYNKTVVFGITDLPKYQQDLAALEKK